MADETRLVAVFDANLASFTKGLSDAKAQSDKFFDGLQAKMQAAERNVSTSFSGLGGAFSKVLSVAALEEFSRSVISMTAGLIDQAKVLNVTVETLQVFRAVMKDAGGTAEDADTILKRLTSTIGAAKLGVGAATDIFAHLGLGPDALKGDTADVLQRVAQALLAIKDPATRARLEVEAFGRSGQEFERVLGQIASGFGPVADKLREQKRLISEIDATSARDSLLKLANAWGQLEAAAAGPLSAILSKFAEIIEKVSELEKKIPALGRTLAGMGIGAVAGSAIPGVGTVTGGILGAGVGFLSSGGSGAADAGASPFPDSVKVIPQIAGTGGGRYPTQAEIEKAKKEAEEIASDVERLTGEMQKFRDGLGKTIATQFHETRKAATDAINQTKDDLASANDQLAVAQADADAHKLQGTESYFNAQRTLLLADTDAQVAQIERRKNAELTAAADQLKNETDFQAARENIEGAANADIAAVRLKFFSRLADIEESQTQRLHDTIQATDALRTAFSDVGVAATHGFTSFRDAAKQALQQISDMIAQLYIMKPLVNGLFGQQGTTGSGVLGSLIGSSGSIANGNIGTGLLGLFDHFAAGGSPPVGVPSLVGEKGPELFVPSVPGTIIPNGAFGTKGNFNVTVVVQGNGDSELMSRMQQGAQTAVVQALSRYDRNLPRRVSQINGDPFFQR